MIVKNLLGAYLVLMSGLVFSAPALDISGVEIGIPLTKVKQQLLKVNPAYKFSEIKSNGNVVGLSGFTKLNEEAGEGLSAGISMNPNGRVGDQMSALQTDDGRVWFLARGQSLPAGGRLKEGALRASLREKYGAPSSAGGISMDWNFDRQGKQLMPAPMSTTKKITSPPCGDDNSHADLGMVGWPGISIHAPTSFPAQCGITIRAQWLTESGGLVSNYLVTIVDVKTMYDQIKGGQLKEKAAQQQKIDAERALNVKPKL